MSILNMHQISMFMAAAESPVAEFWSFTNFEEKKKKIDPFDVIS